MSARSGEVFLHWGTLLKVSFALPEKTSKKWIAVPGIVQTPDTLGGKPRIEGRRISVQDVVIWHFHMGMGLDEIGTEFDLSPAQINATLTYYKLHRDEIDTAIRVQQAFAHEMRQQNQSPLATKLKALRGG